MVLFLAADSCLMEMSLSPVGNPRGVIVHRANRVHQCSLLLAIQCQPLYIIQNYVKPLEIFPVLDWANTSLPQNMY